MSLNTRLGLWLALLLTVICLAAPVLAQDQTASPAPAAASEAPAPEAEKPVEPVKAEVQAEPVKAEAQAEPEKSDAAKGSADGFNPEAAKAFLDGAMGQAMLAYKIPGATLALVKDGEVVYLKGYGYADLEKKLTVDPKLTLFRVGSITKLLTFAALVQQVEQGKLDLNADVNSYLGDMKIASAFVAPITAYNLMTHTPGFEDRIAGEIARNPSELLGLSDYLRRNQPNRIYAAGTIPAYSNYGATLAGLIVERVSGKPYEKYVEDSIIKPLGMNATLNQPLSEGKKAEAASGYTPGGVKGEFELIQAVPAGALSASASDMAAFMLSFLRREGEQGPKILSIEAVKLMLARQFGMLDGLSGSAYGFYEWHPHGRRLLLHEGDTNYFSSILTLYPEHGLGLFISFNSLAGDKARREITEALIDRFYPAAPAPLAGLSQAGPKPAEISGGYEASRTVRRGYTSLTKLMSQANLNALPDGNIELSNNFGASRVFEPIAPLIYREQGKSELLGLIMREGKFEGFCLDSAPDIEFLKLPSSQDRMASQAGLLAGSYLVFISALLGWPLAWLFRRGASPRRPYVPALSGWLGAGAVAAFSAFFALYFWMLQSGNISFALNWKLRLILSLPYVGAALSVVCLGLFTWSITEFFDDVKPKVWSTGGRVHYALFLGACYAAVWILHRFDLIFIPTSVNGIWN